MSDLSIEELKQRLELEKLQAEIRSINMPFYTRPSFWLSLLAALAAFGAIITGYVTGYFDNQKLLNEIKAERLIDQTKVLKIQTADLTVKKMKLLAQIECYELSQIVNLSFLNAIDDHPSKKSKVDMGANNKLTQISEMEIKGVIEVEENISLVTQALSSADSFSDKCNELIDTEVSDYKEIARNIYLFAISSVPMLEYKKTEKVQGIASLKGIFKKISIEASGKYVSEKWESTPYQTWENRIEPIRGIAARKDGFLNNYLDQYFIDDDYTNVIKDIFWPGENTSESVSLKGGDFSEELINKFTKASEGKNN